jgi:hypothetical protein
MATTDTTTRTSPTTRAAEHREGPVARGIEKQTAKLPSDVFLWVAIGTMAASAIIQFTKKKHWSLFVGEWAAPILIMGLYNKLVKLEGHDQVEHA